MIRADPRRIPRVQVFVNGDAREIPDAASVSDLLQAISAPAEGIAVEVNRTIVRRSDHAAHTLSVGDQIEIVGLVGGG